MQHEKYINSWGGGWEGHLEGAIRQLCWEGAEVVVGRVGVVEYTLDGAGEMHARRRPVHIHLCARASACVCMCPRSARTSACFPASVNLFPNL